VVLHLLQVKGPSCGYDLGSDLQAHALTDAEIDKAALYRTLRQLEANGNVKSAWETGDGGPARRVYHLTKKGEEHLAESMDRYVRDARKSLKRPVSARFRAA